MCVCVCCGLQNLCLTKNKMSIKSKSHKSGILNILDAIYHFRCCQKNFVLKYSHNSNIEK